MKGKWYGMIGLLAVGLIVVFSASAAQAGIGPARAVDGLYTALNVGQFEQAAAVFAEDAIVYNRVTDRTYQGAGEILGMLQGMARPGRQFEIVGLAMQGDTITAQVEVSDRGIAWATETVEAVAAGEQIQSLTVTAFHLELWRISP